MKPIFEKYKLPENCVFVPPKVNLELWKLLSSWQRNSDIKFMSIRKYLVTTVNTSLSILSKKHNGDFSVQSIAQKTADVAAISSQASHELSLKLRVFIRNVTNIEYKDFEYKENYSQVVKKLNMTNKLGFITISKHSYSRNRRHAGNKVYYKQNSFLGRDRSNPNQELWKEGRIYQKR